MISAVYGVLPIILLAASLYWARRRRHGQRPPGTLSMSALLACFAVAFGAYYPVIRAIEDSITPDFSKLVSNTAALSASVSVSSVLLYLNHDADEARRGLRLRVRVLVSALTTMAIAFAVTPSSRVWSAKITTTRWAEAPVSLHIYEAAYILFLGYAVYDCLTQTWRRSRAARRTSQRIGLRTTALGCLFVMIYIAYKTFDTISALLGKDFFPGGAHCVGLFNPSRCTFSLTAPAIGVILITAGLTLPAIVWPITKLLTRRWERQSLSHLAPLWQDLTSVLPEIVLEAGGEAQESDFLLHRRVIEVCDGILTLRPYRSPAVQRAAAQAVAQRNMAGTTAGDAIVEAAIVAGAIRAVRNGGEPEPEPAPEAPGTEAREGDLHAETIWLRSVSEHYTANDIVRTASRAAAVRETAQGRA